MNSQRFKFFVFAVSVGGLLMPVSPATAAKPPYANCAPVTRQEYNAAKKQHLLRTRFTEYVRTGLPGRRQYWYCR
jgi:hypothetical protein